MRRRVNSVVVGREREIAEANGFLAEAAQRSCGLLLVGEAGIGKTTIWSAVVDEAGDRGFDASGRAAVRGRGRARLRGADRPLRAGRRRRRSPSCPTSSGLRSSRRFAGRERGDRRPDGRRAGGPRRAAAARPMRHRWSSPSTTSSGSTRRACERSRSRSAGSTTRPSGCVATVRAGFELELTRLAERDGNAIDRIELGGLGQAAARPARLRAHRSDATPAAARAAGQLSGGSPYYALELAATGDPELGVPKSSPCALRARLDACPRRARGGSRRRNPRALRRGRDRRRRCGRGRTSCAAAAVVDVARGTAVVRASAARLHAARDAHARRAARRPPRARGRCSTIPTSGPCTSVAGRMEPSEAVAAGARDASAGRLDRRGAPETAASLAERAAALTPADDDAAATRRLLKASDLYQAAGEGPRPCPAAPRAARRVASAGPDRARVLVRLGWLGAQMDTMLDVRRRRLPGARARRGDGDPEVGAAAHAALARMRGIGGDYRAALRHAELAVAAGATVGGEPDVSVALRRARHRAVLRGRRPRRAAVRATGSSWSRRCGRVGEPYQSPKLQLGLALLYTGQLARARDASLAELLELSVELGRVRSTAGCVLHLAELEVRAGNLAAGGGVRARVRPPRPPAARRAGRTSGTRAARRDAPRAGRGRAPHPDRRRRVLARDRRVDDLARAPPLGARSPRACVGNLAAAKEALEPLPAMLRETGLGEWAVHPVHPDAIETLVGLGEIDEAAELAEELEEYGRRLDRPWGLATAARSAALIASARGELGRGARGGRPRARRARAARLAARARPHAPRARSHPPPPRAAPRRRRDARRGAVDLRRASQPALARPGSRRRNGVSAVVAARATR